MPSADLQVLSISGLVARSRLAFEAIDATQELESGVFVIRNTTTQLYWNGETGAWQGGQFENPATKLSSTMWQLAIQGTARRAFVNTTVTIQFIGDGPDGLLRSATSPEMSIR